MRNGGAEVVDDGNVPETPKKLRALWPREKGRAFGTSLETRNPSSRSLRKSQRECQTKSPAKSDWACRSGRRRSSDTGESRESGLGELEGPRTIARRSERDACEKRIAQTGSAIEEPRQKNAGKAWAEEHRGKHENAGHLRQRLAAEDMRRGHEESSRPGDRERQ